MQKGIVSVVIGQGCESVASAQGMVQKMQKGSATQQSGGGAEGSNPSQGAMGGPQIHQGTPDSVIQRPTNDF